MSYQSNQIFITPDEKVVRRDLLPITVRADLPTLPYTTPWLECGFHPLASVHIYGKSLVGLTADVEISNVPAEGVGEVIATNVSANKVVPLNQAAAWVRVVIKTLTSGKVGVTYSGTPQA